MPKKNPSSRDPSCTFLLRRSFGADVRRRLSSFSRALEQELVMLGVTSRRTRPEPVLPGASARTLAAVGNTRGYFNHKGRPGQRGGSAPRGGTDVMRDVVLSDLQQSLIADTRKSGMETGAFTTLDGVTLQRTVGEPGEVYVGIPDQEVIEVHTHPLDGEAGAYLSANDMARLGITDIVEERVVSLTGDVTVCSREVSLPWQERTPRMIRKFYDAEVERLFNDEPNLSADDTIKGAMLSTAKKFSFSIRQYKLPDIEVISVANSPVPSSGRARRPEPVLPGASARMLVTVGNTRGYFDHDFCETLLIDHLGLCSLLPAGAHTNPLDLFDPKTGDGYEVKVVTAAAKARTRLSPAEVRSKLAYAKRNKLRPNMMMVVVDVDRGEAYAYSRPGIGSYRLTEKEWTFRGKVSL